MSGKNAHWGSEFVNDGIAGAPSVNAQFVKTSHALTDRPDIPVYTATTHELNPHQARHGEPACVGGE